MLHIVLCGPQGMNSQQHRTLRNEFTTHEENIQETLKDGERSRTGASKSVLEFLPDYSSRGQRGLPASHYADGDYSERDDDTLQLAAKTVSDVCFM